MVEIREEYKQKKCKSCKNRKSNIAQDDCNIKTYQYDNYLYCKCVNQDDEVSHTQEIKRKII